ncbi:MAG: ThuA domain-containing protein [Actinomycetes bacterium]
MTADVVVVTQCAPYKTGRMSGVHGSREQAVSAFGEIAGARSWSTMRVDNVTTISEDVLTRARVLALYTIGEVPWSPGQRSLILERLRAGELAIVGVHSATDANHTWDDYGEVIGARFAGHPVSAALPLTVEENDHPATRHFDGNWSLHDELYLFDHVRPDAEVLLRLEDSAVQDLAPGTAQPAAGYPIAWCHRIESGRVFYTALGHFLLAWEHPDYVQHVAGGLAWACGDD